jgi:putative hemolysin
MVNAPLEPEEPDPQRIDPLAGGLRVGNLEVRLARDETEVDAVQALRYRVFYEEMTARPDEEMRRLRRDFDAFDAICDHLLVIDHGWPGGGAVVGTYRLLRRSRIPPGRSFYTADEYDIGRLLAHPGEMVELGRSCVDARFRSGAAIQLLLRGIGAYVMHHGCVAMFGCASLPGTDADRVADQLSYLHHRHLAPIDIRPRALAERYTAMDRIAPETLDMRAVAAKLPPLVKGYLRAGCTVGEGAVIDHQFQTIDVSVVLHMDRVAKRYRSRYGEASEDA